MRLAYMGHLTYQQQALLVIELYKAGFQNDLNLFKDFSLKPHLKTYLSQRQRLNSGKNIRIISLWIVTVSENGIKV